MDLDHTVEILRAIPLFSQLTQPRLVELARAGHTLQVPPGHFVVTEGEAGDSLYAVLEGTLRVLRLDPEGTPIELRRLSSGEAFGEMALLDGSARSASVASLSSSLLFALPRESFLGLLQTSPRFLNEVLANLTRTLRASTDRVTENELERRLLRTEMELERYRALTQMVAGVAHEVNTPLGIVNTAASVIKQRITALKSDRGLRLPPELDDVCEAAELIDSNIRRAHKLVERFKGLSVSHVTEILEPLDLLEVIEETTSLFSINARQAHLRIVIESSPGVRAAPEWVGYRGYLSQVLLNLLSNVERYAYPDGGGGDVGIRVSETPARFEISVIDSGCGITTEAQSRVFDPFYTTGRGRGGTGLGLAIVHNIMTEAFKGSVELTSELGRGTTVTVKFPKVITRP